MRRIFISHAASDSEAASQLAKDLKNAGHEAIVDTIQLGLGDDAIDFMNKGIAEAHAVIILFSHHTVDAKWQRLEINAAVWNEVAQGGGTCIVLRLDNAEIPPLLGPKVYGKLDFTDSNLYKKTIEDICRVVLRDQTATSVVSQALTPDSPNPFRRIRAEYFEERSDLLSKAFASPEASKTRPLEDITPCFLEGSRGTGKSMLLLSLRARVFISRHISEQNPARVFGFYLKLTRGALCNIGVQQTVGTEGSDPDILTAFQPEQVSDISCQEMVICLLESLFSEIEHCMSENLIQHDQAHERGLVEEVSSFFFDSQHTSPRNIGELLDLFAKTHRQLAEFIRRKFIYGENPAVPVVTLDLDALKRVITLVKKSIQALKNSTIVALLDEYENLFPYQQRVINTFVKLCTPVLSVKIAKKLGTADMSATTIGQELQEINDYARLVLVYDVEDPASFKAYRELLEHIVRNSLSNEGLPPQPISGLLPEYTDTEVAEDKLVEQVAALCKLTVDEFNKWPETDRSEKLTYYGEAAIYRTIYGHKGRQPNKRFAGFRDLAFLSSGVIRYFQEILGVAYYHTFGDSGIVDKPLILPPDKQTRAAHLVSTHNLTALSRNVECYGEALKYFLLDLGDCLRHKLLKHSSEPEAARLTVVDPEVLDRNGFDTLRRLLNVGTREGVFQTKEGRPAFKPRHSSDPQPSEFNISRIFAPVLQISPRLRWRTPVTCRELRNLLDPNLRARAKKALMDSVEGTSAKKIQATTPTML